jgi:hypothetical protein
MMQFKPFFFSSSSSMEQALPKPITLRYRIPMHTDALHVLCCHTGQPQNSIEIFFPAGAE